MDTETDEYYDVVVIGGGLSGIAAARTYLEFKPIARLLILEADSCVGGIWSKGKSNQTNSLLGISMTDISSRSELPWLPCPGWHKVFWLLRHADRGT